uniref:Uncharacterized protein n=1 Tax=Lepeophtheirus salmonis TaxID=72036 RepID=A0A0K2TQI1_LEPSM
MEINRGPLPPNASSHDSLIYYGRQYSMTNRANKYRKSSGWGPLLSSISSILKTNNL